MIQDYIIRINLKRSIDPERLEEWIEANNPEDGDITIETVHGEHVMERGSDVQLECPKCGNGAHYRSTVNGVARFHHSDRQCQMQPEEVPDP